MRGIEQQFLALYKGFTEIVPAQLLKPFDERELELIIGGLVSIDIHDWKQNTRLKVEIRFCRPVDSNFRSYNTCAVDSQAENDIIRVYL